MRGSTSTGWRPFFCTGEGLNTHTAQDSTRQHQAAPGSTRHAPDNTRQYQTAIEHVFYGSCSFSGSAGCSVLSASSVSVLLFRSSLLCLIDFIWVQVPFRSSVPLPCHKPLAPSVFFVSSAPVCLLSLAGPACRPAKPDRGQRGLAPRRTARRASVVRRIRAKVRLVTISDGQPSFGRPGAGQLVAASSG